MKLIIQIPCFNEEDTLPITFSDLPKHIPGIDVIETLIIDDGSKDKTIEIARHIGVDHIIEFNRNKGLAFAFAAGIEKCLELGADIIVNTDGDNQYCGQDIEKLVLPILLKQADVVIGDRQTDKIEHFSYIKRKLQFLGSTLIRSLSETDVKDAVSGFRAYSRDAAIRLNILSEFSYTIENIIQFGQQRFKIVSVPIRTNGKLRESRLFKSIPSFIINQLKTIFRVYTTYKAFRVFTLMGFLLMIPGLLGLARFFVFYIFFGGSGHVQSLIYSAVFMNIGFIVFMFGIIAELISNNRKLIEKNLYISKKILEKL
jgi:glycosyltransferase involved in cell wall biosynthesis